MSFPYTPRIQDAKIESLHTHHDFLNLLRLRHLGWMNSAEEPRVRQAHQELAGLIEQVTDRYNHLLEELEQQRE